MKEFDYINNKIVGYVNITYNGNANIEVVGYCDLKNEFHRLLEAEVLELFPPRGRVFAHNFASRYYDLNGQLACFSGRLSESEGEYYDKYVWDKSEDVYKYGNKVYMIDGVINQDGQNNYNVFFRRNMIEPNSENFIRSGERIFHIGVNSSDSLVPYWKKSSLQLIQLQRKEFIVGYTLPNKDGVVDIATDEQLVDWYITKILRKNWVEISKEQSFKSIEPYVRDILFSVKGLEPSILESRMNRLRSINSNFTLTFEKLQHMSEVPWLSKLVENSILKYKDEYYALITQQNEEELNRIQEEHNLLIQEKKVGLKQELATIDSEYQKEIRALDSQKEELLMAIESENLRLSVVEKKVEEKRHSIAILDEKLSRLEERKKTIVEDFSIVRDVLEVASKTSGFNSESGCTFALESIDVVERKGLMYQAYKKSLENVFINNNISYSGVSTIGDQIAGYNIILVPNAVIAKAIVAATQKCFFMMEYVSASWKSFIDLWDNGLGFLFEKSTNNSEAIHFLILQNINLTYLPNYMQPLIDIQAGVIDKLPINGMSFPSNLRILCTITEDEVIPLSPKCLKYIGCVNPEGLKDISTPKFTFEGDERLGYLSPSQLIEARKNLKDIPNFYKKYIDE